MGFKDKIMAQAVDHAAKGLAKNMKTLEDHMIQCLDNQVEFEDYLKKILKEVKK